MKTKSKAKIFLADDRGLCETCYYRSRQTFNYGNFFSEYKHPFGLLYLLNDIMQAGGSRMHLHAGENSYAMILPVAGAVNCKKTGAKETTVAAGQLLVYSMAAGETIESGNPFADAKVNFLQIRLRAADDRGQVNDVLVTFDDLNKNINQLVNVLPVYAGVLPFTVSIGKFSGRGEAVYPVSKPGAGMFLFVLAGAFEADGRLLHERDGLALWDTDEIEMEALSNDAIILLIETAL